MFDNFTEGKKEAKKGRLTLAKAKVFIEMIKDKDTLFDMSTNDPDRKRQLDIEWGVKMGEMGKIYLKDQRDPRLMSCDHEVDPVFYRAWMRSQRLKEREGGYTTRRDEQFLGKNIDDISDWMREQGEIPSSTSPESSPTNTPVKVTSKGIETQIMEKG